MKNRKRYGVFTPYSVVILILLAIVAPFYAATGCSVQDDVDAAVTEDPQVMYQKAIQDARVVTPEEVSKNLTALDKYATQLKWEGTPGKSRVLVVTWTNKTYYDDYVGKDYVMPKNAWITVCPELQNWYKEQGFSSAEFPSLRIEQLLGLPPYTGKTKFVEFWVNLDDLFRPSPDPEINDHEADVDFPNSRFLVFDPNATIKDDDDDQYYTYTNWFNNLMQKSYTGENAHPWTRLGYTYDWGKTDNHIGLSEFVLCSGSTVKVKAITPNEDYFDN